MSSMIAFPFTFIFSFPYAQEDAFSSLSIL
jgi:hypothetical protein